MQAAHTLRQDLTKMTVRAILALFIIPLIVWGFAYHALSTFDAGYARALDRNIAELGEQATVRQAEISMMQANPPSRVCSTDDPVSAEYRAEMCDPTGENGQFLWARRIAGWTMVGGAALLALAALLGMAAFGGRSAQYHSISIAWRTLAFGSALEIIIQGSMLVWLSFWLTAFFMHVYVIKLIVIAGIFAGLAVLATVVTIFKRSKNVHEVEGELVTEADAPELWARIRKLASDLGTAAPDQIVAGIDTNFFVTESVVQLGSEQLTGRTMFVSLPLMRVLDQSEAEAVLVHELAHLSGGDTSSGARLGPKLVRFDRYCQEMADGGLTGIAHCLMSVYRVIFELAYKRDSRAREFLADRTAAQANNGDAVARSLIKVVAYSAYRNKVEEQLFSQQEKHDHAIGIAAFVAQGLHPFASSGEFLSTMETANVPHPFDSHPSLEERMRNVGSTLTAEQFEAVIKSEVQDSWANRINTAQAIEQRLWTDYEARFAQVHEHNLAYRYLPQDDAEREIVEKYFPGEDFALKDGLSLSVRYNGMYLPGEKDLVLWNDVANIEYDSGYTGDALKLTLPDGTRKVKLPGIDKQKEDLKIALGKYWHRDKVAHGKA